MHAKGKVHRLRKYTSLAVVVVLVLPIAFSLSMGNAYNNNETADLSYVGRDLTTRGDWIGSQYGSSQGAYSMRDSTRWRNTTL